MRFLNDTTDAPELAPAPPEALNGNGRDEAVAGLEEVRPEGSFGLADYEAVIGRPGMDELRRLAEPLAGHGWVNVNSTAMGGGVAEMLRSAGPFARLAGSRCPLVHHSRQPRVLPGHQEVPQPASGSGLAHFPRGDLRRLPRHHRRERPQYLHRIGPHGHPRSAARRHDHERADPRERDLALSHRHIGPRQDRVALPCCRTSTIATARSSPCGSSWGPGLKIPVYEIMPCIDPLAEKNRHYTRAEALDILQPLFKAHDVDPERPIFAAISRYDRSQEPGDDSEGLPTHLPKRGAGIRSPTSCSSATPPPTTPRATRC